jgi:fibronectin type 3 domain-containing protein
VKRLVSVLLAAVAAAAAFAAVTLGDPPPVTINAPSTVAATDPTGADVQFTATSHVDPALVIHCTPPDQDGTSFTAHLPVGDTTITCTDTDNNMAQATVTVTPYVAPPAPDTTPPTLHLPGNSTVEATSGSGATVNYTVTATDDTDPSPSVSCNPPPGTFPLGTTTVNCTATDSSGNSASGSFTVTVRDTTPPSLSLPGDIGVPATSSSGAVVTYSASASDLVSGSVTVNCDHASGSTFPFGTTTVTCSAKDAANNTATGSFRVTVGDSAGPTFSNVPASITVEASGPSGSRVNYTPPTASDNVDGPTPVDCSPASGSLFPLGTTTVHCSATDNHGNTSSASFTVTVRDTTKPSLLIPDNYTVYADTATGISASSHYPSIWLSSASATDLVDPHPRIVTDAPEFFTIGVHLVTFSAIDASGNSVSKSATLEVKAMPAPGTPPLPPPAPVAGPPNVNALKVVSGDRVVRLSWRMPAAVDHVVVHRSLTVGGGEQVVYTGKKTSYTDRAVANGLEYRYVVVSVDKDGDESAGAAAVASPKHNPLRSPKDGAKLTSPPKLKWDRNAEATYYNVQLFRGKIKILSTWPTSSALSLPRTWKYKGKKYTLSKGVYSWYVWPGFGKRSAVDYGDAMGPNSFQIVR